MGLAIVLLLSTAINAGCNVIIGPRGVQSLEVGGVDPPTIEWTLPLNYTGEVIFNWDGEYSGQTEEVWPSKNWINDSDGLDTVIYQYKWLNDGEWMNRTPLLLESNSTHGLYSYNFTQRVWWDWGTNRVQIEGGSFKFRIFANDSLGNWRTTPIIGYNGGYLFVNRPLIYYVLLAAPAIITAGFIAIVVIVVLVRKRKRVVE